jgi:peptidoglycan hydrolase-like protein with peptidoglycan-binding domain
MVTWKFTTAAALASVMVVGSAFAQATSDSTKADSTKTDSMKGDAGSKADKKSGAMRGSRAGGMAATDEKVKAAQQALKDKGHDPGNVDGKLGPKTQSALRDFQKAQGIEASGHLDAKTTQALGMDGGKTSGSGSSSTSGSASPSTSGTSDATKSDTGKSAAPKSEGKK